MTEIEKEAEAIVEMFNNIDYIEELSIEEADYLNTQCAIVYVNGLISELNNYAHKVVIVTKEDYYENRLEHLTKLREYLKSKL